MAARKELCQQINGKKGNTAANLYVKGNGNTDGFVAFSQPTALADLTSDVCALAFQSTTLKFWNGTTWASVGGGGGGINSWDDLYASDKSMTISGDTVTFGLTHATNNGLTLTASGGSAGHALQITNSGTGYDVNGTSGTWFVTKAGAATFVGITPGGDITTTAAAYDWDLVDNNAAALSFDAAGAAGILVLVTTNGTEGVTMSGTLGVTGVVTVSAGVVSSDGPVAITDNSNIANGLTFANNTVTTYGNATDAGPVRFSSTSLTTGHLLTLSLDESELNGGSYIRCWGQDAGAVHFSVAERGAVTIAGIAAGGSNSLTVTAGDVLMSDGSITMVDADNAASFSLTNDTASTLGAAADTGIVHFTTESLTTGVLLNLSADETNLAGGFYLRAYGQDAAAGVFTVGEYGATVITSANATAVPLTIVANSATTVTGGLVAIAANALSTGVGILVSSTSLGLAAGQLLNLDHTASGTLSAAKTGQLVDIVSSRTHTAATVIGDDYDAVSIIRTSVVNNAGGQLDEDGACLYILNTATQTAGAMTDRVNGVELSMQGGAEALGYGLQITHSGTTGGRAIDVVASQTTGTVALITANSLTTTGVGLSLVSTGTGMTSGSLFRLNSGTTAALATNGIVSLTAAGAFTSTAVTDAFLMVNCVGTASGTIQSLLATALTTGVGIYVGSTGTGITTGSLFRGVSGTTGAVATNGLLSIQATGNYTSTANMGILAAIADTTTAGTVGYLSGAALVGGTVLFLQATQATMTTGRYVSCYDAATEVFGIGANGHIHSTVSADGPTIAVTQQNGITAAAITAGGSDTCGVITTTGTNNNGGSSILQITFGKTYTTAPKGVLLFPANQSASKGSSTAGATLYATAYVSGTAATTFDITIPADSAATATPSWRYLVIQ